VTQLNGRRRGALYFYVVEQAASSLILAGGQSGEMRFAACLSLIHLGSTLLQPLAGVVHRSASVKVATHSRHA